MKCVAKYYDGKNAISHNVELFMAEEYLLIKLESGEVNKMPYNELVISSALRMNEVTVFGDKENKIAMVFGRKGDIGWQIAIEDQAFYKSLYERIPKSEFFLSSLHSQHKLALFLLIIVVLIILTVDMSLRKFSGELAQIVPESVLKDAGDQMLKTIESQHKVCNTGEGLWALKKLKEGLLINDEINIVVVEDPQVNALTLPGNTIVILSGLIDKVTDETEMYGVLAHEIAHLRKNHVSRAIVENIGMRIVLASFGGQNDMKISNDVVGELLNLRNSREFEDEADREALKILIDAKLTNRGLLQFLKRMDNKNHVDEFLSTHPSNKKRMIVVSSSVYEASQKQILSSAEWASLKRICE